MDERFKQPEDLNETSIRTRPIDDAAHPSREDEINIHNQTNYSAELQISEHKNETPNGTMNYLDRLINEVKTRLLRQGGFPLENDVNAAKISGRRKINKPSKKAKSKKSNSARKAKKSNLARKSKKSKVAKKKAEINQEHEDFLDQMKTTATTKKKARCFYKKRLVTASGKGPKDHPVCCNCCRFSVLGCY